MSEISISTGGFWSTKIHRAGRISYISNYLWDYEDLGFLRFLGHKPQDVVFVN